MKHTVINTGSPEPARPRRIVRVTVEVGPRYVVTMTEDVDRFLANVGRDDPTPVNVQWEPFEPKRLTKAECRDYNEGVHTLSWWVLKVAWGWLNENDLTGIGTHFTGSPYVEIEGIPDGRCTSTTSDPGNGLADEEAA